MFTIKITNDLFEHCQKMVKTHNFGHRFTANGNEEQQLTGIIGQSVVMEAFGLGYVDGTSGFDHGVDLIIYGKKVDVKTMGRTTYVKPSYTNNFLKLQDYFDTQIYIFCSYHKLNKEVTICGWIDKSNFVSRRKLFPKGTIRTRTDGTSFTTFADLYEIDMLQLNDIKSFDDLKHQLETT
ncbi:MAG: hypothetical protein ACSHXF_02005 [Aquaticitalea sp.]